jgi:hypothetical protein
MLSGDGTVVTTGRRFVVQVMNRRLVGVLATAIVLGACDPRPPLREPGHVMPDAGGAVAIAPPDANSPVAELPVDASEGVDGSGADESAGNGSAAGATATAGTTGGAGEDGAAGATTTPETTGAAGDNGAAGAMATAGTTGAAGDNCGGGGAPAVCMNSTVFTPGGSMANCPPESTWKATAMPTPPSHFLGISDSELQPQYAIDGDPTTRYSSGQNQMGTEWFEVDLGRAVMVSGISISEGATPDSTTDVARAYKVEVSLDGSTWTTVSTCTFAAQPDEVINFAAVMARYIRVDQTGTTCVYWWSIHEFTVVCQP